MCQGVQAGLPQTSSPSLDLAGGGGEAEGGRGQAGLALAGGGGCGRAGNVSLESPLLLSHWTARWTRGSVELCEEQDRERTFQSPCLAWSGKMTGELEVLFFLGAVWLVPS